MQLLPFILSIDHDKLGGKIHWQSSRKLIIRLVGFSLLDMRVRYSPFFKFRNKFSSVCYSGFGFTFSRTFSFSFPMTLAVTAAFPLVFPKFPRLHVIPYTSAPCLPGLLNYRLFASTTFSLFSNNLHSLLDLSSCFDVLTIFTNVYIYLSRLDWDQKILKLIPWWKIS